MNKIRFLSDQEIKLIAAGEVVEGPASIIKELVENSIDAKSNFITIMYEDNGLTEITIIDDGIGILKDDLLNALKPHATSKLDDINDLYYKNNIFFGFRGEALAAIATVSEFKLISKNRIENSGYGISSHHGVISEVFFESSNYGTTITVKKLFHNIPARKKYIQNEKYLDKEIQYIIKGLILSYPHITFTIYKNNKIQRVYEAEKSHIKRMYQLCNHTPNRYLEINYQDIYMKLKGIISFSEYGSYDKSKIFILANNRLIKQYKIMQKCIKPYYAENFIKRYPELYLKIEVSPDQIDVNVHPRKEEVLFLYQNKIENLLEKIITETLENRSKKILEQSKDTFIETKKQDKEIFPPIKENISKNIDYESRQIIAKNILDEIDLVVPITKKIDHIKENISSEIHIDTALNKKNNFNQQNLFTDSKENKTQFVGILDNTYILLLKEKSILCIDQHALHEKILYEEYQNKYIQENILSHRLLFPHEINLNDQEIIIMRDYESLFNQLGIFYSLINNNMKIISLPSLFVDTNNPMLFISKYIIIIEENKNYDLIRIKKLLIHDIAALYACKNAIKSGDLITELEVNLLLKKKDKINEITFCPHGRPLYFEITSDLLATLCKRK